MKFGSLEIIHVTDFLVWEKICILIFKWSQFSNWHKASYINCILISWINIVWADRWNPKNCNQMVLFIFFQDFYKMWGGKIVPKSTPFYKAIWELIPFYSKSERQDKGKMMFFNISIYNIDGFIWPVLSGRSLFFLQANIFCFYE